MNNKFKASVLLFLSIILITVSSCKKHNDETYMNEAKIIGIDKGACPCCGGYEITIDNYQLPVGMTYFLANEFPTGFSVNENETFPISIKLDWSIDTAHCVGNYIDITRISRN